jgi:protein subunit release factor A
MARNIAVYTWPPVTSGIQTNSVRPGIMIEDTSLNIGVFCNHFRSQHRNKKLALDILTKMQVELNETSEE